GFAIRRETKSSQQPVKSAAGREPGGFQQALELVQPVLEGGLRLHLDLEPAVGQSPHPSGMNRPQGDDDCLTGDPEAVEDLEDALDLTERDGGEPHRHPYPSAAARPRVRADAAPRSTRYQTRPASSTIRTTSPMKSAVTAASRRRLKIWTRTSPSFATGTVPPARASACARKPIAGSLAKIFW